MMRGGKIISKEALLVLGFLSAIAMAGAQSLLPGNMEAIDIVTLSDGSLTATFVDNKALGTQHKAGYNGIASLTHSELDLSVFVRDYAGFNLEHIFGGDSLIELFEPRKLPMQLFQPGEHEAWLYQARTRLSNVESLTKFRLTEPHFIDVDFQCIIHSDEFFRHGYAGMFWASYIDRPLDKGIYFIGYEGSGNDPQWIQAYSPKHGEVSTHRAVLEKDSFYFAPNFNATLASHFSKFHFEKPFYYGRFHDMVLVYFFDTDQVIRFSQSPTGGGPDNPAWDFQFLIPNFAINQVYSFRARIIYKPFISAEEIVSEYEKWMKDQH
ncbi:MAG: hypothetical protein OEM26_12720 [Saprospiraceae bacterium]|nr:hypothetical protein [Saprospiraceae bacterium]